MAFVQPHIRSESFSGTRDSRILGMFSLVVHVSLLNRPYMGSAGLKCVCTNTKVNKMHYRRTCLCFCNQCMSGCAPSYVIHANRCVSKSHFTFTSTIAMRAVILSMILSMIRIRKIYCRMCCYTPLSLCYRDYAEQIYQ